MKGSEGQAGLAGLVATYRNRYRPSGRVDWKAWTEDLENRLETQLPINVIPSLDVHPLESVLRNLPEPSYQEACTSAFLADYLLSQGGQLLGREEVRANETEVVVGTGDAAGLALRCDLDAVSQGDGAFAHTCGHSLNMAAAVKTWEKLKRAGRAEHLWLVLQPAEEGPGSSLDGYVHPEGISGGQYLRRRGLYASISRLLSCHVDTALRESEVRITEGVATASACKLVWQLAGRPAHAALPWEGHNPIADLGALLSSIEDVNKRFEDLPRSSYGLISPTEIRTAPGEINTLRAWVSISGISRLIGEVKSYFCWKSRQGLRVVRRSREQSMFLGVAPPEWFPEDGAAGQARAR